MRLSVNIRGVLLFLLICCLLNGGMAMAAKKNAAPEEQPPASLQSRNAPQKPAANAGETVKTEYFSLKIPQGWTMPYPLTKKPDGVAGVFANARTQVTVTLNIIRIKLSAQEFANRILPNMKKSGLKTGKLTPANGLYKIDISGQIHGQAWFGSNNTICTATVVLAPTRDISAANEILGAIKSSTRQLFPPKI